MHIFATEQLGPTQSLTPEGYLLCAGVPIARIGSQIYAAHELPTLEAGRDGLITIHREESEVFHPDTIASFEGKSVTIYHQFVDPTNVKRVEVGHAQNVRRSEVERDLLIADLLIKDARAIALVQDDKKPLREISCGYDAEYVQVSPGVAYQRNIIGNHVALVERGRAGPRCSIQDEEPETMPTAKKPGLSGLLAKLIRSARTGDSALAKKTADEAEEELERMQDEEREEEMRAKDAEISELKEKLEKTQDAASVEACIEMCKQLSPEDREKVIAGCKRMSTGDADEELDENGQPKAKTGDEDEPTEEEKQKTADAMRDIASRAEILVPGFAMPTADSAPRRLADVALVQRKVLSDAMKTEDGRNIVTPLLAGRTIDALTVDAVATVFAAASEVMRQTNNARGARPGVKTRDFGATVTAAEINRRNAEFYANQK